MGVLFCVSVHLKIDPFVSTYKKPRFWRDREQRQGWGSKHLSHSFLDLLSRPWPPCHFSYAHYCHYPCSMETRMPSDDGQWLCRERREGFLTAWNPGHRGKTAVKFAAKPGQVELNTTQMSPPLPPSSPWSYWRLQSRLTLKKLLAHASMRRHYRSLQPWCNPGWCDVFDHMSRNGVSKCCMKLIPVDFYIQNCNIKAGIARSTSILPVAAAVQIAPDIFYDQNLPFILRRYWTDYKYNINVTSILRCTFEASFAYHKYGCTFNNLVCGIFVFGCDSFVI